MVQISKALRNIPIPIIVRNPNINPLFDWLVSIYYY